MKVKEYYKTDDEFMNGLRESYPLSEDAAFEILKFLTVFSMGCAYLQVLTRQRAQQRKGDVLEVDQDKLNRFGERLELFKMDLEVMGFRGPKVRSMLGSACNYIRLD